MGEFGFRELSGHFEFSQKLLGLRSRCEIS